ncbi:DUF7511 domain-containing protein [Haloferacaceae archaeon DSL9]
MSPTKIPPQTVRSYLATIGFHEQWRAAHPPEPAVEFLSRTTVTPHGHHECTIYEPDLPEYEQMTHWLTAREDAYVDLDDWQ